MASEFMTTDEVAKRFGMTKPAFLQAYRRGSLDLPFEPIRFSLSKSKNVKLRWRRQDVEDHIEALIASDV